MNVVFGFQVKVGCFLGYDSYFHFNRRIMNYVIGQTVAAEVQVYIKALLQILAVSNLLQYKFSV